jgi:membrane protein required for colicin V production
MDLALAWVDLLLLGVLLLSVLVGLWRGLLFELLSLAGWVVAYFGSPLVAPLLASWMPAQRMGPSLIHVASLLIAFVLILVVWGLAAKLLRAMIHATPLSIVDRLGGAGFGALRGVLLSLLLVVVVSMTPVATSSTWQASQLAPWLHGVLLGLRPMLPAEVVKLIPASA